MSEIEKQFFDTFGIEPREYTQCISMGCRDICGDCNNCQFHNIYKIDYPQITDRILLELICINPLCVEFIRPKDISELKNIIIKYFIDNLKSYAELSEAEIFKQQVQALFKENTNDR